MAALDFHAVHIVQSDPTATTLEDELAKLNAGTAPYEAAALLHSVLQSGALFTIIWQETA